MALKTSRKKRRRWTRPCKPPAIPANIWTTLGFCSWPQPTNSEQVNQWPVCKQTQVNHGLNKPSPKTTQSFLNPLTCILAWYIYIYSRCIEIVNSNQPKLPVFSILLLFFASRPPQTPQRRKKTSSNWMDFWCIERISKDAKRLTPSPEVQCHSSVAEWIKMNQIYHVSSPLPEG